MGIARRLASRLPNLLPHRPSHIPTALLSGIQILTFGAGPATSGSASINGRVVFDMSAPVERTSYLTKIEVNVSSVGDGTGILMIGQRNGSNALNAVANKVTISGVTTTGTQVLEAGTHFSSGILLRPGDVIGMGQSTGGFATVQEVVTSGTGPVFVASTLTPIYNTTPSNSTLKLRATFTATVASTSPATVTEPSTLYYGGIPNSSDGDQGAGQETLVGSNGSPMRYAGVMTGVQCSVLNAGRMEFQVWRPSTGSFVGSFFADLSVGDNQTITNPVPFAVAAEDLLFRRSIGARLKSQAWVSGAGQVYLTSYPPTGATLTALTSRSSMRPIVRRSLTASEIADPTIRTKTLLGEDTFPGTSTPANWTLASPWAVNSGLNASGSGGATSTALFGFFSNAQKKITEALITFNSATSQVAICFSPQDGGSFNHGGIYEIDASGGASSAFIRMYEWNGGVSKGTLGASKSVPFTIVAGRDYLLKIEKNRFVNILTLTDQVTSQSVTLTTDRDGGISVAASATFTGRQWGKAGLMFTGGDVKVKRFSRWTNCKSNPFLIFFGDSNGEGGFELGGNASDLAYPNQIERIRGLADVLNVSRGGASSDEALLCFNQDLDPFTPTYVWWNLITNDNVYATWAANTATAIAAIQAKGAIPILATSLPYDSKLAVNLQCNTDIRNGAFGSIAYAELQNYLSTAGGDGVMNPIYGNGIHLYITGHDRVVEKVQADLPFLFA